MKAKQSRLFSEAQTQAVLDKILEALGFKPISDIERGKPIKVKLGRKTTTIFADKVVSIKIKNKRTAIMIIEGKKPGEDLDLALDQGISYAKNYDPNYLVPYVVVSDGKIFEIYRSVPQQELLKIRITDDDIEEIDRGISSKKLLQRYKPLIDFTKEHLEKHEPETPELSLDVFENLKPFEDEQKFDRIMNYCATLIFTNDETSEDLILSELLKILFVKKFEEDKLSKSKDVINRFTITQWNNYNENIDPEGNIISDKLFPEMQEKYRKEKIFEGEKINLRDETINAIVGILQNYSIIKTQIEVKGRVFENLLSKQFKGSRGQYFTPKEIVDFINEIAEPRPGEKIIDPCCGSGRFLIEAYHRLWGQIETRYEGDQKEIKTKLDELKDELLWCVDIDPRLVRIAKMNMIMHDDGSTNVFKLNSLKKELFENVEENSFDLIMTNPPFGGMVIDEISPKYEIKFKKGQRSQTEFIKVFNRLLKENKRVCTIIDDGILNTTSMNPLRTFILDNFIIKGVFSLPRATFSQYNTVKSSILYLEKKDKNKKYVDYDVFMSISYKPGKNVEKELEKVDLKHISKLFLKFKRNGEDIKDEKGFCFVLKSSQLEHRFDPYHFHPIHKEVLDELNASSSVKSVTDVLDKIENKKISIDEDKEYSIISSIGSNMGQILTEKLSGNELPKGIKRVFKKDDIIVSRINAKIGCVGILLDEKEVYATGEYYGFRKKNEKDIIRYFQLQLRTKESIMQIRKYATGQYLRIGDDDFGKIIILIPKPEIQNKITKPIEQKIESIQSLKKEIGDEVLNLNRNLKDI